MIFFSGVNAQDYSVNLPKTNLQIFYELSKRNFYKIGNQLDINGSNKIYQVRFSDKSDAEGFFFENLKSQFSNFIFIIEDKNSKKDINFNINKLILKTSYEKAKSNLLLNKKLKRTISFSCEFIFKDSIELYSGGFNDLYTDTVNYENVDYIEKDDYSFTKGKLPDEPLFEKILIPGLVVIASAVTIVLFFIIRTK